MKLYINEKTNYMVNENEEPTMKVADWVIDYLEENEKVNYIMGYIEVDSEDLALAQIEYLSSLY